MSALVACCNYSRSCKIRDQIYFFLFKIWLQSVRRGRAFGILLSIIGLPHFRKERYPMRIDISTLQHARNIRQYQNVCNNSPSQQVVFSLFILIFLLLYQVLYLITLTTALATSYFKPLQIAKKVNCLSSNNCFMFCLIKHDISTRDLCE